RRSSSRPSATTRGTRASTAPASKLGRRRSARACRMRSIWLLAFAVFIGACSKHHDAVPTAAPPVATSTIAPIVTAPPARDEHADLWTYTNTNFRRRFSVLVPKELDEQPEPESGDGREFKSKDGVRVAAWTMYLGDEPDAFDALYRDALKPSG